MSAQPEALRLAEQLEAIGLRGPVAAELRRLYPHELANEVWQVKTQWVQDTAKPEELGMHRADVMRQRLEQAKVQRDALLEALKAFADEIVPNNPSDPIWVKARAAIAKAEEA